MLWLRDMTSQVAGSQAIFEEKFLFFLPFLGEKCKKCQQKTAKCLIMSYSTSPPSKISNFKRFLTISNFW